jgi:hypothetical protein
MRKHPLLPGCLCFVLLSILFSACGQATPVSAQTILGRWQVTDNSHMAVPNSFFWFTMEYVEFRGDGTVASLIRWSSMDGPELRLHKTAHYALTDTNHLAVTGACRHHDPCTGFYTAMLAGDELTIADTVGRLELKRVGDASEVLPPPFEGPLPSPTPALTK